MNRRRLLSALMNGGGAILAGILGIPALLAALTPALRGGRDGRWRRVGRLEDFPVNEVRQANVRVGRDDWSRTLSEKGVYVWRIKEDDVIVYSRNCTDLSCPVNFDPGSECFFCPCHGGIFAKDGTPLAGPPQVPLYRYEHRLRDGLLEIDLGSLPPMT
jgi:menaquinol-cytochrome c reductase iron-sulfur subunit